MTLFQILLDGPGILKYSDFGLSKVEGENLEDLFQKFSDAAETWGTDANLDDSKRSRTAGRFTLIFLVGLSLLAILNSVGQIR